MARRRTPSGGSGDRAPYGLHLARVDKILAKEQDSTKYDLFIFKVISSIDRSGKDLGNINEGKAEFMRVGPGFLVERLAAVTDAASIEKDGDDVIWDPDDFVGIEVYIVIGPQTVKGKTYPQIQAFFSLDASREEMVAVTNAKLGQMNEPSSDDDIPF